MFKRPLCVLCLLFMLACFAADRLGLAAVRGNPLSRSLQEQISSLSSARISGEISSIRTKEDSTDLILSNVRLLLGKKSYPLSSVKTTLKDKIEYLPGTILILSGHPEPIEGPRNPGEFDFRNYYAARNIYYSIEEASVVSATKSHSLLRSLLLAAKGLFSDTLDDCTGSDSPFFRAMVLGDRRDLSDETSLLFQITGILHILSISGLHISILGAAFRNMLKRTGVSLELSVLLPLGIIILYGMMTGSGISALRAVVMYLISSGGMLIGRIYDMQSALALAAMLLLIERPACLYDSGFLMSFAAAAGVGFVLPVLSRTFRHSGRPHRVRKSEKLLKKAGSSFLASLSILLVTLPITLYFYYEVSLCGIFLNLLALPAAAVILTSGTAAMLLGSFFVPAGTLSALPGRAVLLLLRKVSAFSARLPFTSIITGRPSFIRIVLYYLFLVLFLCLCSYCIKVRKSRKKRGILASSLFPCVLTPAFIVSALFLLVLRPLPLFSVTCLDIGQGDCVVIRTPENRTFIIDSGSTNKNNIARYQLLPYLKSQKISHIDAIFITHTDADHVNGISTLLEYIDQGLTGVTAEALLLPDWADPPEQWKDLEAKAKKAGIQTGRAFRGASFSSNDLTLHILSPCPGTHVTDVNDDGTVLLVEYKGFKGLFPGDISSAAENRLLQDGLLCDVTYLKVPHHGSRYSSSAPFLEALSPEIAVISCSETNTYGHPAPEAVERLESAGCTVYYTMKSGAVTVYQKSDRLYISGFADS